MSRDASTTLTVLTQTFDILGRVCMARNPDSGAKLIWRDVASATLRSWDQPNTADERSQGFEYDELRRSLRRWVNGSTTYLAEETTYGESLPDAKARNARGQAYSHKDGAGIATDEQRDFQGKVTKSVRQLTTNTTKDVPDWSKSVAVDETFTTLTTYDALGRVTRIDTPHNQSVPASQVYPVYNEANLLDRVEASLRGATTRTTFVQNIDYDAKGQRQRIQYGNGATTEYGYDPLTYRLIQLVTTRPPSKKPDPQPEDGTLLQKLTYTYDATGNVVEIADAAQEAIYFKNQIVKATAQYEYDALYRLISATGREHDSNGAATEPEREGFNAPQNLLSDGQSLRNYTREWTYDHVGNILSLVHTANASTSSIGTWSRAYSYATDSNRLASTTVNKTTQTYSHNVHGSFTAMPHLDAMEWTADEHLHKITRGTSQTWYTYDSAGQRVRKVTDKGGFTEERLYLGGFEIYRKRQGTSVTLERETLHLMDGNRRIALVETKTVDNTTTLPLPSTVTRYQLDNHLQSATLELDETASVISYEEYYPYGDTSYRSARSGVEVSEKRYRYTGKEKDEESGLYYHGARYYAAWLGRWTAADPAGMVDGACLYAYVRNHPTGLVDPDGRAATDTQDRLSSARFTSRQSRQIDEFTPSKSVEDLMSRIHENKRIIAVQQAKQAHAAKMREQLSRAELVFSTPSGSLGYLVSSAFTDDQDKRLAGGELGYAVGTLALARFAYAARTRVESSGTQNFGSYDRFDGREYANGAPLEPSNSASIKSRQSETSSNNSIIVYPRSAININEVKERNLEPDPSTGKGKPGEVSAAIEFEGVFGGTLERIPSQQNRMNPDYVITTGPMTGKTVDFMLTPSTVKEALLTNQFFLKNLPAFQRQLQRHTEKADFIPIDTRFLSESNLAALDKVIATLPIQAQQKVVLFK